MPLALSIDSLDSVPEPLRAAYVAKDGKFVLDAEFEDTTGLKNTVAATRKEREAAEKKAKEAEARAAELQRRIEESDLASKGLTDAKKEWDEKYLKPILSDLEKAKMEARSLKLDGKVKSAAGEADIIDTEAFWKLHGEDFDLDDKGAPFWKADPSKPIKDAIASYRETKAYLFKGTQASGGGAAGSQSGGSGSGSKNPNEWTSQDIEDYINRNGAEAYSRLLQERMLDATKPKKAA